MSVWDLLLPGRLYHCLKGMLVFFDIPLVFMEMAFGRYVSLGPVTTWKAIPLCKGNVSVLWYTTGVQGNGVWSVCQSGTHYFLEGCTSVNNKVNLSVLWYTTGVHGNGFCSVC